MHFLLTYVLRHTRSCKIPTENYTDLPQLPSPPRPSPDEYHHNMLGFSQPTVYEASNCFFSYGRLSHLDPQQLPTAWEAKGKPWSSVSLDGFVSRVGISLVVQSTRSSSTPSLSPSRHMHLCPRPINWSCRLISPCPKTNGRRFKGRFLAKNSHQSSVASP